MLFYTHPGGGWCGASALASASDSAGNSGSPPPEDNEKEDSRGASSAALASAPPRSSPPAPPPSPPPPTPSPPVPAPEEDNLCCEVESGGGRCPGYPPAWKMFKCKCGATIHDICKVYHNCGGQQGGRTVKPEPVEKGRRVKLEQPPPAPPPKRLRPTVKLEPTEERQGVKQEPSPALPLPAPTSAPAPAPTPTPPPSPTRKTPHPTEPVTGKAKRRKQQRVGVRWTDESGTRLESTRVFEVDPGKVLKSSRKNNPVERLRGLR